MALLRRLMGDALRRQRLHQRRTLREVSSAARVSLGYLSEVERGQKEASSELLASICGALGIRLADLLREVSDSMSVTEPAELALEGLPAVPETLPPTLPPLEPVGGDAPGAVGAPSVGSPAARSVRAEALRGAASGPDASLQRRVVAAA